MKKITYTLILSSCLIVSCSSSKNTESMKPPPADTVEIVKPTRMFTPPSVSEKPSRQPANEYRTNDECIGIIKESVGLRLDAYSDQNGNWYIGYGHSQGVETGMRITESEAEQYLRDDLRVFEESVSRMVDVSVTENEFSAMVCLTYNIGPGGFAESTVLRKVNEEEWNEAADAILLWNKVNGEVNSYLVSRREKERALFLKN